MAKSTKSAQSAPAAKSAPKAAQAPAPKAKGGKAAPATVQAPAKVAKLDKAAQSAARAAIAAKASGQAKPAKAPKASGQSAQRGQFAGKKIRVLVKPADAKLRGDRVARFELVAKAKTTDEVLGATYTRGDGESATFISSNFAPFIEKGLIELY